MGNQPSSSDGHQQSNGSAGNGHHNHGGSAAVGSSSGTNNASRQLKSFMRSTGVLGLSRSELDERCKPSGLYPSCQWEDKAIRRLIGDGKIAARLKGTEHRQTASDRECPICFLQYSELNVTKCCQANICTECYLQVRPQKEKSPCCPFCNNNRLSVTVAKTMDVDAIMEREEDEQRVIEAKIRKAIEGDKTDTTTADDDVSTPNKPPLDDNAFGSSLEKHRLRTRALSSCSDNDKSLKSQQSQQSDDDLISSLAMTAEERRALEDEMRAQHSHPLSLRIEQEAEERRAQNEREYYRTQGGRLLELRARGMNPGRRGRMYQSRLASDPGLSFLFQPETGLAGSSAAASGGGSSQAPRRNRDWNQIVDAFERGGNGEINSLDDLVVLEAAMILSMEEESRRRGTGATGPGRSSSTTESTNDSGAENNMFDASRHAGEGFPLLRSLLAGRQPTSSSRSEATDGAGPTGVRGAGGTGSDEPNEQLLSVARNLNSRRRNRNSLLRAYRSGSMNSAMDTAGLLLRGVTEEEQIAMAIAASLQDQPSSAASENDDESNAEGAEDGSSEAAAPSENVEEEQVETPGEGEQQQPINQAAQSSETAGTQEDYSSSHSDYESTMEHLDGEQQRCSNDNDINSEIAARQVGAAETVASGEASNLGEVNNEV